MGRKSIEGAMNKQDFCRELAARALIDEQQARVLTDIFLDILTDQMSIQQPVCFTGFGTFDTWVPEATATPAVDGPSSQQARCRPDFRPSWKLTRLIASEVEDPSKRTLRHRTVLTEPLTAPRSKRSRGRPRKEDSREGNSG